MERSFFSERAKTTFLNLSDKNTKFFHSIVKKKHVCNTLSSLCRTDAKIINDTDIIVADFVGFYRNLFGIKVPKMLTDWPVFREGYTLKEQEQLALISCVTDMEIKQTIYYIGKEKTFGLHGYMAFFKEKRGVVR